MNSVDLKKRLNLSFSDRINWMDRIEKYESKINPDDPARLDIAKHSLLSEAG
jgi:hypothetical protein